LIFTGFFGKLKKTRRGGSGAVPPTRQPSSNSAGAIMRNLAFLFMAAAPLFPAPPQPARPVNPDASPAARRLLAFLHEIRGRYTLSAQHNYANSGSKNTDLTRAIAGKTPLIWGSDFSFCYRGSEPQKFQHCGPLNLTAFGEPLYYLDATPEQVRERLVETAVRMSGLGHIVTLMWHAPPPGEGNCVDGDKIWTWSRRPSPKEWDEITTEGTPLNLAWRKQVDEIAGYLARLRDAGVPVLWRPYHEMNGVWFWWCNQRDGGFRRLWRMMFDRYTRVHGLDNLVWVWNTNAPRTTPGDEAGAYADFWPGSDVVDVLAADVYHRDWKQSHHDDLLKLADGKPIALGEVGDSPDPGLLDSQPGWAWFMPWFLQTWNPEALRRICADPRVLALEDVAPDSGAGWRIRASQ
jgi:mannan endo-1,4-beta-mannosidase